MQARLKPTQEKELSILVYDKTALRSIPQSIHIQSFADVADKKLARGRNIFVVTTALELSALASFVKWAHEHKRLRGLLVRQENYPLWITQLLDKADLRLLKNLLVHSNNEVVKRVLTAWKYGAQNQLIADAAVFDDRLFVRDCALNRYEIGFADLKGLAAIPKAQRTNFVISEEGTRISWTKSHVDINLDSIKSVLDPAPSKKEAQEHNRVFGAAIAKFRKACKIKQTDVIGMDERHLRRIESGAQRATHKCLQGLATAHRMTLNKYLNRVSNTIDV